MRLHSLTMMWKFDLMKRKRFEWEDQQIGGASAAYW
jgi:hypothetical protein